VNLNNRIGRLEKIERNRDGGPITVVLIEAEAGQPTARREKQDSNGRKVLEIIYDPATGPPQLPAGPLKLFQGVNPADLV
jgi:hypothetical protein